MTAPLRGPLRERDLPVSEARVQAVWNRLRVSRGLEEAPRRRALPFLMAAAAVLAVVVGVELWVVNVTPRQAEATVLPAAPPPTGPAEAPAPPSSLAPLTFADGTPVPASVRAHGALELRLSDGSILDLAPGAELRFLLNEGGVFELAQHTGEVHYDIERRGRRWVIDAGPGSVEVLGTGFSLHRNEDVLDVDVDEGLVLVRSPHLHDGAVRLGVGELLHLEPAHTELEGLDEQASAPTQTGATRTWTSQELMRRADEARRVGDQGRAEVILAEVVSRGDRQSAVAAFTLARLQMHRDPASAARGFQRAIRLGLGEPLRLTAFERRIDALDAAGLDSSAARRQLLDAYPEKTEP